MPADAPLERDCDRILPSSKPVQPERVDDVAPDQVRLLVARELEDAAAGREHAAHRGRRRRSPALGAG